ncbi:hypothetical protein QJS66_14555 [Kocuria rhizophila]|nr:hypothetical protein QJS66_14555 [Kocuria rhizophila]
MTVIVFIECRAAVPFLPGDSLLFTGGLLHEALNIPLWLMILVPFIAAVAGPGEVFPGHRYGRRFLQGRRPFLKTAYLRQTEDFFPVAGAGRSCSRASVPIVQEAYVPLVAGATPPPPAVHGAGGICWINYRRRDQLPSLTASN